MHPVRVLQPPNNIPKREGCPQLVHPLRPNQRQRTMARQKTHRHVDAGENSRPKGSTEGRKEKNGRENIGRRPSRKRKTKEKRKRYKSDESVKEFQIEIVHM